MSKPRLGILQAGKAPDSMLADYADYNQLFVNLLGQEEFDYRHWPVLDGIFPLSTDEADAWLITGSRHGAYEPHDWIPPLEDLIKAIYAKGNPMVGICFGHQIIAQALGGKVEKYSQGWSVGRVEYSLDEKVFPGSISKDIESSDSTALFAFHQDQVIEAPSCAVNVGSSHFCQHAALLYDNKILTIQPHPEFDQRFLQGLLDNRGSILPSEIKNGAEQSIHLPVARESVANTLRQFLKQVPN